ncbi:putative transcription factor interactor and regulator CCHC(Zn) family [Helianthus annuus]|nr:putative transcription factor interactor and regulator CCHC(Zn) family [Helianthus annuus]KAJ0925132.1 putative transcription factor interactor and regulator CCHC(Zn) family [Helianthus annuus]
MAGDEADPKPIEPSSPYYIHASDYPWQMQVNDSLTDSNYSDWAQEMMNFLFTKNKMVFVDGSIPKPAEGHAMHMPWKRCDAMIKGWLTTAMNKEIRGSVKYANSAEEIWSDLKERFGKESAPRAYELKHLLTTTKQENAFVAVYFTKLRSLWDEIESVLPIPKCSCSGCKCDVGKKLAEFKEKERLYEFLLGLDSDFSTIRTQVLAMKPTPNFREAYRLTLEDEHQRNLTSGRRNSDPTVFQTSVQTSKENRNPQQCSAGNQGSKRPENPNKNEVCGHCGKTGHNRNGCFEVIGYPEWWPGKTKREKGKPRAGCVETEGGAGGVAGLSEDQYQSLLKHFTNTKEPTNQGDYTPRANMAGLTLEEADWCG